jgi:hypothetical protein
MLNKSELKELLSKCIATVVFEKKDGTIREMKCTLKEDICSLKENITETHPTTIHRKENDNALSVWDMEKSAWRSFRIDSIKEVSLS